MPRCLTAVFVLLFCGVLALPARGDEDFVQIRDKYGAVGRIYVRQETRMSLMGHTMEYSGTWYWERDSGRFHLNHQYQGDDGPFIKVFDGTEVWTYDNDSGTYMRVTPPEGIRPTDDENSDILALLDGSVFDRKFELKQGTVNEKTVWKLSVPDPQDADFRLTYYFDTKTLELLRLKSELIQDGEPTPFWTTNFTEWVLDQEELPEGTFHFTPPEGSREVDPAHFLNEPPPGGGQESGQEGGQESGSEGDPQEGSRGGDAARPEDMTEVAQIQGHPAPELETTDLQGNAVRLSDLRGRVVILDFWATWCPPCKREIPGFVQLQEELGGRGLTVVGVSSDPVEKQTAFAEEQDVNYPFWKEPDTVPAPYNLVKFIPTTLIIDRQGVVRHVHVGYTEKDAFVQELTALLEAQ